MGTATVHFLVGILPPSIPTAAPPQGGQCWRGATIFPGRHANVRPGSGSDSAGFSARADFYITRGRGFCPHGGGCGGFPSQSLCVTCGNFCQRLGRLLRCCVVFPGLVKVVRVGASTHWLSFVCCLGWWGREEGAWLLLGLPGCLSSQLIQCLCAKEDEAPSCKRTQPCTRTRGLARRAQAVWPLAGQHEPCTTCTVTRDCPVVTGSSWPPKDQGGFGDF